MKCLVEKWKSDMLNMTNQLEIPNYLSVVSAVQCHPVVPEVFEEVWEDFILNVLWFHTISSTALLHHL